MRSRTDVVDNGSERSLVMVVPRVTSRNTRPDPEVVERAKRRRFTAQYKLRILEEAKACQAPSEVGALLRREGLYSSHLTQWRRARREGSLKALSKQRGPQGRRGDAVAVENEQLRKENARLRRRLQQAQTILEIQKKASEILGHPPKSAVKRRRRMIGAAEHWPRLSGWRGRAGRWVWRGLRSAVPVSHRS